MGIQLSPRKGYNSPLFSTRIYGREATEIAGVDNVARAKKQGLKTREVGTEKQGWTSREWTRRHEETGMDNAGVSDRENNVLVALSLHA